MTSMKRFLLYSSARQHLPALLPIWGVLPLSPLPLLLFLLCLALVAFVFFRIILLRKEREISREKLDFFIRTAHDLRTPLTLIKTPLEEMLEEERQLSEKGTDNLRMALRNVDALLRMSHNLIYLERTERQHSSPVQRQEHELNAYMAGMLQLFRPYAQGKEIRLIYESDFTSLNVWMDKEKMDSILKNLFSNALKYTGRGGEVKVTATVGEQEWSITVSDTGIGIPQAEQRRLFKAHFRGSNAVNSQVTGSGIGLLLVSKLVRQLGGRLHFNSTEGRGSTFSISFPRHDAQPPSEAPLARLLVVEDNDDLREYLRQSLSTTYHVQTCTNATDALEIVHGYAPHLVISDIMMPGMRGDELCRKLKSDIETSHIPVILLTALHTNENIIQGLQCGADEYMPKPFNMGVLRATIATILKNRELLRRQYTTLEPDAHTASSSPTMPANSAGELDWKFIANVKRHIGMQIGNPQFNVDALCLLVGMSRTSFYNKLKALTGQAPADYIRIIRLQHAARLLGEKRHSVTEVAEQCGFNDAKYFREVFKKYYGVSPKHYGQGK
ncbi:MAG: response regulator [Bacteroides sp.]|nr:response regulator [Bacteroides sp.]